MSTVDSVSARIRSKIMIANKGANTKLELEVRKALYREGFRYRLHEKDLPGKPDIVLPRWNAVIFVHGCFWHGHTCHRNPHAKTNKPYWLDKIQRNRARDIEVRHTLLDMGWRVLVVWECAIRRQSPPFSRSENLSKVITWLRNGGGQAVLTESSFEEYEGS